MSDTSIDVLLHEVADWLGQTNDTLALDEDNQVLIEVGEGGQVVALDYHPDEHQLVLSCIIAPQAQSRESAFWEAMLRANFLWQDTFGATLCLSPSGDLPVLQHRVGLDILGGSELIGLIEGMANLTLHLMDGLTQSAEEIAANDTPTMDMPISPMGEGHFIRG